MEAVLTTSLRLVLNHRILENMKKENQSGEICLKDGVFSYRIDDWEWAVRLTDVRLIGEYTTANGPYEDDYFLVFLTAKENGWHQASFYSTGSQELMAALGKELDISIELGLISSVEYRTRILWPPSLQGKPLMQVVPKQTGLGRLWTRITGNEDTVLSDEAKSVLPDRKSDL